MDYEDIYDMYEQFYDSYKNISYENLLKINNFKKVLILRPH